MQSKSKLKLLFCGLLLALPFLTAPTVEAQSKKKTKAPSSETRKVRNPQTSNGIHVMPMDPNMDAAELEKQGYLLHPYNRSPEFREPSETPDPEIRDKIFDKAGMKASLSKWDHFQKDLLYMSAWKYTLSRLQEKYPNVPAAKLQQLQKLIRAEERK